MNLKKFYLFSNFTEGELGRLKLISEVKKYKRGNILFYQGDEPKILYLLLKGSVKVYKLDSKSNEIIIHIFDTMTLIAELANLEEMPYPASAEALSSIEVLEIDYQKFKEEFLSDSKTAFEFIKSLTKKIKNLENLIANLSLDSKARVAKFIYENEQLFLDSKNTKVASILNITPETLSRVIKKFKDEAILDSESRVLNKERLKELSML